MPAFGWRRVGRQESDGRTGHEVEQALGPVVDARKGAPLRVEQRRHQHRGADSESDGDRHADPTPTAPPILQQHQEHQRPDEVELLLDRQRPRVLQRRGRGELGEIGLVGENQVPVVHVEQGGDGVAPEARKVDEAVGARAAEESVADEVQRKRQHDEEQRRQQAPGPAPPEGDQVDSARADPLLQQEVATRKPDRTKTGRPRGSLPGPIRSAGGTPPHP